MDDDLRLTVDMPMRQVSADHDSTIPISAMMGDAIREWTALLSERADQIHAARKGENHAWVTLAGVWFNFQKIHRQYETQLENLPQLTRNLQIALNSLARALHDAGVELILPEGEVYSDALADLLENVSQVYYADIREPVIYEVITPAVCRQGEVLQIGQVVLALPADNQ